MSSVYDSAEQSILRRLKFADGLKIALDSSANTSILKYIPGTTYPHPPLTYPFELAGKLAFDLVESIRTGRIVPHIGKPHMSVLDLTPPVQQHPRYRGYWYNAAAHTLVGMHLGIDLIKNNGKYYVLENNLSAAIRETRRRIYADALDPIVSGLASMAKAGGFKTLVPYGGAWSAQYLEEFDLAAREFGIEIRPAERRYIRRGCPNIMAALPREPTPDTMYVVFPYRGGPLDYFIDEKRMTGLWLEQTIGRHGSPTGRLAAIPNHRELTVPPLEETGRWPNLVVKVSPSAQSRDILTGRFRDEAEARAALGLSDRGDLPTAFRLRWHDRLGEAVFGTRQVVYQPFIPPELDPNGHPQIVRLHVFVSPTTHRFLAAHRVISSQPAPETLPFGLIEDDKTFVVNYSRGAHYARLSEEEEQEMAAVADEFGQILDIAVRQRFETGPGDDRAA